MAERAFNQTNSDIKDISFFMNNLDSVFMI